MKRRGFIKRLFGVATAAVVSEKLIAADPVLLHDAAHHDLTGGLGLAQAKPEGGVYFPDPLDAPTKADRENMRRFGLDPNNSQHLIAYMTEKRETKRLSREFYGGEATK